MSKTAGDPCQHCQKRLSAGKGIIVCRRCDNVDQWPNSKRTAV